MSRNLVPGAVLAVFIALVSKSDAHFLWAEIRETPNRHVAIELAETPGDSVVPGVNARSDRVKPVPSTLKYRLAANAIDFGGPVSASQKAVGAAMEYGYLERAGAKFKLCYYAKGVQGVEDAGVKLGLPVELTAQAKGGDLVVTVLQNGKPAPKADITYHFPGNTDLKGAAGASGQFVVPKGAGKPVAVMARVEEKAKGTIDGKPYSLIRRYSTLTIGRFSKEATEARSPAYLALKAAVENRETFPEKLLGFQMEIDADVDGKPVAGSFSYDPGTGVAAKLDGDEEAKKWVEGQIKSIVMHRNSGRFEDGDGGYEVEFTGTENALGKQVLVKDASGTRYRLKEGQILEVERNMGQTRLLVSVLDSIDTVPGKKLATQMTVSTFDMATGALRSASLITDTFAPNDGIWLPTRRRVVQNHKDGAAVRVIHFKAPKLVLR